MQPRTLVIVKTGFMACSAFDSLEGQKIIAQRTTVTHGRNTKINQSKEKINPTEKGKSQYTVCFGCEWRNL